MTRRWSFITSSYLSSCLRIQNYAPQPWIGLFPQLVNPRMHDSFPSSSPNLTSMPSNFSDPKIRIKSSAMIRRTLMRLITWRPSLATDCQFYATRGVQCILHESASPKCRLFINFNGFFILSRIASVAAYPWTLDQKSHIRVPQAEYQCRARPFWRLLRLAYLLQQ